jgi:hypothetical protein
MRVVLTLLCVLTLAAPALAQTSSPPAPEAESKAAEPVQVDPSRMGISLERIMKGLRFEEMRERRTDSPLKLEYKVQVFGTAPRIDILGDYDIGKDGPLPYGAPTHQDFLNQLTPQAYRSPTVPISSVALWAIGQLMQRGAKSRCEQEIAEYRELVMQGVAVSAPRCTQ